MSEKLIVWFETRECRDFCGTNGVVLYHTGDWMDIVWSTYGRDLGRYPIESEVPPGPALMVLDAEVCETTGMVTGTWRPATAIDLIDADLLGGLE